VVTKLKCGEFQKNTFILYIFIRFCHWGFALFVCVLCRLPNVVSVSGLIVHSWLLDSMEDYIGQWAKLRSSISISFLPIQWFYIKTIYSVDSFGLLVLYQSRIFNKYVFGLFSSVLVLMGHLLYHTTMLVEMYEKIVWYPSVIIFSLIISISDIYHSTCKMVFFKWLFGIYGVINCKIG
jgi:hypothetical protein